jgi:hypothetical protein
MIYKVDKKYRIAGEFTDPKTQKVIAHDNTYFCIAPYDDNGNVAGKPVLVKIKSASLRDNIDVGDYVEVYNNQYGQPSMVVLVQKGDEK